jgi:hypothetical protein
VGNGLWSSLLQVCKAWEASARRVRHGTRLVLLRTGIVLDGEEGGSLGMSLEPHHSLPITLLNQSPLLELKCIILALMRSH